MADKDNWRAALAEYGRDGEMTFKQWKAYFSKLTREQRYALWKAYETQKADSEIYKAYKYDIDNLMYLLDDCGI